MRVLYVAHRVPDAPNKGEKIRAFHQLARLCERHAVDLFALEDGATLHAETPAWGARLRSFEVFPLSKSAGRWRSLAAVLRGGSLTSAHFAEPGLRRRLAERLRADPPDVVVVCSGAMDPLVRGFRPRVLDLVDVDSAKFREYCESGVVRGLRGLACSLEARRLEELEKNAVADANLTLVCTEPEAELLRSFARPRRLEVLGNGVDLDAFPLHRGERASAEILFVGALDYPPNVDAVVWLAQGILPLVRAGQPDVRVTLVGHRPAPEVLALQSLAGVRVIADAPEVLSHLHRATLALQPFRLARGIQNKALEALASGLPLVLTPKTARALQGEAERHYLVGEDESQLAAHALRLLKQPALRESLRVEGRRLVESRFSWKGILDRFESLVTETAGTATQGPERSSR